MNDTRSHMLATMDVKKLLFKLSVPATLGMLVNGLYNFFDTLFVAIKEGEVAIGALTLAFPVQMIVMAVGLMVGIGSASVFSRSYGKEDRETMDAVVNSAIIFDVALALFIALLVYFNIDGILKFFAASDGNYTFAKQYLSIILLGLVPLTLSMVFNNLARAEGRARLAMISMMIGTGLNIILDPIFLFWLDMGVRGVAIATVISQVIAFIYIFYHSFDEESVLHIALNKLFHINWDVVRQIAIIGFPTFLRNSIAALLTIGIFRIFDYYAPNDVEIYTSLYGVINRIIFFLFMPAFGLIQGLTPIAGFNFGAKNPKRLEEVIWYTIKLLLVYFTLAFLFVQIASPALFNLFSKNNDPFFISHGTDIFRIISLGYFLVAFQVVLGAIYQAFGYPLRAMFVSLSRQFIFFVPILFTMLSIFGLNGLWYTFAAADITSGLVSLGLLIYEMKQVHIDLATNV